MSTFLLKSEVISQTLSGFASIGVVAFALFGAMGTVGCNALLGDYVADLPQGTQTDSGSDTPSNDDSDSGIDTDGSTVLETDSNPCPHVCVGADTCSRMLGSPASGYSCEGATVCCQLEYTQGQFDEYCTSAGGCGGACSEGACEIYCGGSGDCSYSCDTGGCTFVCADSKECKFVCDGGGCTVITVDHATVSEFKCQYGDCDMYCMGEGGCVLDDCEAGGCSVEQCPVEVVDCGGGKNAQACNRGCP